MAESMQISPEWEVVPLAEGDAQSPQRALDPRPLGDALAVSGDARQRVRSICSLPFAVVTKGTTNRIVGR